MASTTLLSMVIGVNPGDLQMPFTNDGVTSLSKERETQYRITFVLQVLQILTSIFVNTELSQEILKRLRQFDSCLCL